MNPKNFLTWANAHGPPLFDARLKRVPSDFQVSEQLAFEFSGEGEHDLLRVEKTNANTTWVARNLARHAGIRVSDVGYAGLKDRHAITSQWFSVRRLNAKGTDWDSLEVDGVRILDVRRHNRKLKRGAHRGNHFRIALRSPHVSTSKAEIENRVARIGQMGVPNYFGEQRFGRNGNNVELAHEVLSGRRVHRDKRSIAISAARSLIFNGILNVRVQRGTWNTIIAGELANLSGSRSVFSVEGVNDELVRRCQVHDIHPTATLWGDGAPLSTADVAALESKIALRHTVLAKGLTNVRAQPSSRPLRLVPGDLSSEIKDGVLWLEFTLPKGGYATAVVREIANVLPLF